MNREKQCPDCKVSLADTAIHNHIGSKSCWGKSVPILNEETKAIWGYWKRKRDTQSRTEIDFKLSATETMQLFEDAGITAKDIGKASHQYALARWGDFGHYEMGNCRFVTVKENRDEIEWPETWVMTLAHPNRKVTHTPQGTYNSLNEAARAYGTSHKTISGRINSKTERMKEYYYV